MKIRGYRENDSGAGNENPTSPSKASGKTCR